MISETALIHAENTPEIMRGTFDKPWNFVGEVKHSEPPGYLSAYCDKCNGSLISNLTHNLSIGPEPVPSSFVPVHLDGFQFITDDMIEIIVYFGICPECQSIYWMRQGPPFQRARYLEPATT